MTESLVRKPVQGESRSGLGRHVVNWKKVNLTHSSEAAPSITGEMNPFISDNNFMMTQYTLWVHTSLSSRVEVEAKEVVEIIATGASKFECHTICSDRLASR